MFTRTYTGLNSLQESRTLLTQKCQEAKAVAQKVWQSAQISVLRALLHVPSTFAPPLCGQVAATKKAVTALKATMEQACLDARSEDADPGEPPQRLSACDITGDLLVQLERVSPTVYRPRDQVHPGACMLLKAHKVVAASRRRSHTSRQVVS